MYGKKSKTGKKSVTSWTCDIPPGPYFMSTSTGEVVQAYRLYSDVQGAFTTGAIPKADGTYGTFPAMIEVLPTFHVKLL
jgi:hypothetical protein